MPFDEVDAARVAARDADAAAVEAEAGAGATAVLHGMLATLAEVLGELDRRLVSIEGAVHRREEPDPDAALDAVHDRLDRLTAAVDGVGAALREAGSAADDDPDTALDALDAVAARLEARFDVLEARLPAVEALLGPVQRVEATLREVHSAVVEGMLEVVSRQTRLVEDVQRAVVAARGAGGGDTDRAALREELERLEVALRGQTAEITGQARSVADVVGALDGRLRDIAEGVRAVSQHAGALAAVPKRLEALREELSGFTRGPGSGGVAHSA